MRRKRNLKSRARSKTKKKGPATRVGIVHLSAAQGRSILDREAHRLLGMSGARFRQLWKAGAIEDPDRPEVLSVAALVPLG